MSANRDELSIRKDLLVAQSALYRAQIKVEVSTFRARAARGSSWIGIAVRCFSLARTLLACAPTAHATPRTWISR